MSSRIILTRVTDHVAMLRKYRVFIDGRKVATIPYAEIREFFVKPGRHEVQVRIDWWKSNLVNIEVVNGDTFHLECGSNWKGWRLMLSLVSSWFTLWPKGWIWLRMTPNNRVEASVNSSASF